MKKYFIALLCIISTNLGAQTWIQLGNPPTSFTARNHPVTFAIGDKAYIGTGYTSPNTVHDDFYSYDPSTDTWTSMSPFPGGARGFAYGVENNGKGYVGFGLTASNIPLDDLWEFDPNTNAWKQLASCPGPARRHPALVATPGKIYVGCGDGFSGNLNDWWEYDIATDSWTQRANFPSVVRHHPYFFTIGSDPYVGFGHGAGIYKDMYRYDALTDSWTQIATLPSQGRVAGTQFSHNGKGYILSGQGEDHNNLATGEFWEYDPVANSWTSLPPHPGTGRWAPGSFVIGSTLYFTSGAGFGNAQVDISDIWKYDLPFPVSVDRIEKDDNIEIYPNPARHQLTIGYNTQIIAVDVHTIFGAKVNLRADRINEQKVELNTENLAPGTYIIKIQSKEGVSSKRFVKAD